MGMFKVTPSELKSAAEEVKSYNEKLRTEVAALAEQQEQLKSMWEGEANTNFNTAFQNDKNQMDKLSQVIDKYVQTLIDMASKYSESENRNSETAKTRTYR